MTSSAVPPPALITLSTRGTRTPARLAIRADEGLVLGRPDDRGRGPGVADVAQLGEPVCPVEQVGVAVIGAEGLDEQPPPVPGDRHELPGALCLDPGRLDAGH